MRRAQEERSLKRFLDHTSSRFLLVSIAAALCGGGLAQVLLRHVGQDQAWCLYAANQVLHGVQLSGPELVEVNPPFIIWFSCLPVLFSNLVHLSILEGFRLFFDLLVLASTTYTTYLIRKFFQFGAPEIWLCFALLISAHFWLIYGDSLGQREQLLVLFLTPYLVLAAARHGHRSAGDRHVIAGRQLSHGLQSIVIGLLGAIGVCLKPQHLLDVLMVEGLLWERSRSWRSPLNISALALGGGLIAYGITVSVFGRAYLDNTLPLLRLTYPSLNQPYIRLLSPTVIVVLLLLGAGAILRKAILRGAILHSTDCGDLALMFGVASAGSALAYFQQHKGWSYQFIPAGMFTLLCLGFVLLGSLQLREPMAWPKRPSRITLSELAVGSIICLGCFIINLKVGKRWDYFGEKKKVLSRMFAQYPSGVSVSYIAVEPWEMPLVMEQHKILGQRMNYFWLLPAIILNQDPAANPASTHLTSNQVAFLSAEQRRITVEDIERWHPVVVVFDQCGPNLCQALKREGYENVLGWYLRDPSFVRLWSSYRLSNKVGDLESYVRVR